MTFWTALVIMLPLSDDPMGRVLYPDAASCRAALNAVSATLPYDHRLRCEPTGVASASPRPQPNPRRN